MVHELALRESVGRGPAIVYVFYALELAGLVGGVVMLLTAVIWRKIARRHASWLNFIVTWIISCASYIFLIGEPLDWKPNHALCLIQAALIYSVPTLTAGASIALVIQVYTTLCSLLTMPMSRRIPWTAALVVCPYVPAWAMFVFSLKVGLTDPSLVQRPDGGAYCNLNTSSPGRVSAILVSVLMLLCLPVEVIIFRNIWRAWATLKEDNRGFVSTIVRVLAFTLVGMVSIILSLVCLILPYGYDAAFHIVIAMLPVFSVVIFGTQKDIFAAWASGFRRQRPHGEDTWEVFTPNESRQSVTVSRQVSEV
ncbi:hypothetical protein DFH06DRAFT_653134 [Mycena polygramma]|nr:hypothetical protein DFH06DRAFT_653134 [Mycena polygramma]